MQGKLLSAQEESRKEIGLKEIDGTPSGWNHMLGLWVLSGRGDQICIRRWQTKSGCVSSAGKTDVS